ncbi:signal peptidase II [Micromonospora sp. DT81.3]|uniref:signal peptidase II n=1 Tax=Micromonospora sp. DT81.3 TaxID=3416523 RepID=UPI003CF12108
MSRPAIGLTLVVAGVGLILDQATKAIARGSLQPGDQFPVFGDLLSLTLIYNPGAAFSLASGSTWILTVLAVLATGATIWFATRLRGVWWAIALGLILGGTVGNLIDRLTNPPSFGQGYVTDFIAYGDLFVGNVADILLVAGFAMTGLIILRTSRHPVSDTAGEDLNNLADADRSREVPQ